MGKSNLIPLRIPRQGGLVLQLDQLVGFEGVKILAQLLKRYNLEHKVTIKDIAYKANLLPVTVSRIMNRETKAPRMLTCIMLFKALDFKAVRFE